MRGDEWLARHSTVYRDWSWHRMGLRIAREEDDAKNAKGQPPPEERIEWRAFWLCEVFPAGAAGGLERALVELDEKAYGVPSRSYAERVRGRSGSWGGALTDPARERLLGLSRESEFVFTTLRGSHYRPSSRSHHWNRVRCGAGLGNVDLYTATRHYFGWYAWNVLELDARDIALHFGHRDGGELVRKTYGHPDAKLARERVRQAFRDAPPVPVPLVAASTPGRY